MSLVSRQESSVERLTGRIIDVACGCGGLPVLEIISKCGIYAQLGWFDHCAVVQICSHEAVLVVGRSVRRIITLCVIIGCGSLRNTGVAASGGPVIAVGHVQLEVRKEVHTVVHLCICNHSCHIGLGIGLHKQSKRVLHSLRTRLAPIHDFSISAEFFRAGINWKGGIEGGSIPDGRRSSEAVVVPGSLDIHPKLEIIIEE